MHYERRSIRPKNGIKSVNEIGVIAAILAILGRIPYFAFGSAFSIYHSTALYSYYCIIVGAIGILLFVLDAIRGRAFRLQCYCLLLFLAVAFLSFLINGYGRSAASREFEFFCLWGISGVMAGIYLSEEKRAISAIKYMDLLWLLLTIGSASFIAHGLSGTWTAVSDEGMDYQICSYYAAIAFGLNLAFLTLDRGLSKKVRFWFAPSKIFKVISLCSLAVQAFCVLVSGGRGGIVLLAVFLLSFSIIYLKNRNRSILIRLLVLPIVVIVVYLAFVFVSGNMSYGGISRIFSDSGRLDLYNQAMQLYLDRPLFGYGFFGFVDSLGLYRYPHNIVLQLLLSCGTIGTIVLVYFFGRLYFNLFQLIKARPELVCFGILAVYSLVHLLVSGSFISDSVFMATMGFAANGFLTRDCNLSVPGISTSSAKNQQQLVGSTLWNNCESKITRVDKRSNSWRRMPY